MRAKTEKLYPDSGVELSSFTARNYDQVMNTASLGLYSVFIHRAIKAMDIQPGDRILDLGCGTGRNACIMAKYLGDDGAITGMDISPIMEGQFHKKCVKHPNFTFVRQRIDQPFALTERFDKIFISFVIHGFPHEVRHVILRNIKNHLKPGGSFLMLDYAEFNLDEMLSVYRYVFKKIECRYAFDFIERDWKQILADYSFSGFKEYFFIKNYVRLLKARKNE